MGRADQDRSLIPDPLLGALTRRAAPRTVRPRGLDHWLIMRIEAGRARVACGEAGERIAETGDWVLIAPDAPHDYGAVPGGPGWDVLWALFAPRETWYPLLRWPEAGPGVSVLRPADGVLAARLRGRLAEAVELAIQPTLADLAMNALEAVLLWARTALPDAEDPAADPRLRAAAAHLLSGAPGRPDIAGAAHRAGISPPQLNRLFRRAYGTSPARWLEDRRHERACRMLAASPLPVQDIALAAGFADPFYFSARFRRRTGLSPSAWRDRRSQVR
jgi:AraC family transcriptional regulator of arabinose operon